MKKAMLAFLMAGTVFAGEPVPPPQEIGINTSKMVAVVDPATGKITLKNGGEWEEVAYALLGAVNGLRKQYTECVQQSAPKAKKK